jgi:hypothetical protein
MQVVMAAVSQRDLVVPDLSQAGQDGRALRQRLKVRNPIIAAHPVAAKG